MNSFNTQQLLERLASLLRSESRKLLLEHGLLPVQCDALQYLSRCNRYSDTPMAVTEFLGQTKGSVSQTLKVLENKGFLKKSSDKSDKRVTRLAITKKGQILVERILPSPLMQTAGDLIEDDKLLVINSSLSMLLSTLQRANNFKTFGQCATCRYNTKINTGVYLCGLTQENLSLSDIALICREHSPCESSKAL